MYAFEGLLLSLCEMKLKNYGTGIVKYFNCMLSTSVPTPILVSFTLFEGMLGSLSQSFLRLYVAVTCTAHETRPREYEVWRLNIETVKNIFNHKLTVISFNIRKLSSITFNNLSPRIYIPSHTYLPLFEAVL